MMRLTRSIGLCAAATLFLGPPATRAQQPPAGQAPGTQPPAQQSTQPSAESMGVSLKSIRNKLKQLPEEKPATASRNGLRYDFFVDVLGIRPPIEFFKDFDLSTKGGVRWGAPTHQEVLSAVSPYWVNAMRPVGSGVDLLSVARKKK